MKQATTQLVAVDSVVQRNQPNFDKSQCSALSSKVKFCFLGSMNRMSGYSPNISTLESWYLHAWKFINVFESKLIWYESKQAPHQRNCIVHVCVHLLVWLLTINFKFVHSNFSWRLNVYCHMHFTSAWWKRIKRLGVKTTQIKACTTTYFVYKLYHDRPWSHKRQKFICKVVEGIMHERCSYIAEIQLMIWVSCWCSCPSWQILLLNSCMACVWWKKIKTACLGSSHNDQASPYSLKS